MYLCKQEHGFSVFLRVCNLEYKVPLSLHMYKSMFRPEVIRRFELCFFRPCKTFILASDIRNPPRGYLAERSTSVYINLVRCVYQCFTFSLVLGVSPIAIVVCLINILICRSAERRVE